MHIVQTNTCFTYRDKFEMIHQWSSHLRCKIQDSMLEERNIVIGSHLVHKCNVYPNLHVYLCT